jgi:flagellar biosynthesis chaperone FliJ
MAKLTYPLERVMDIKKRRVQEAERVLREKRAALEQEKEKLRQREQERDKVRDHRDAKLQQMRDEMDHETHTPTILQMKAYIKIVQEHLVLEEGKVDEQKKHVAAAEVQVEEARKFLKEKEMEVDKIKMHKKDWLVLMKKEIEVEEGRESDEVGTVVFLTRRRANS